jgi:HD-like signal output (HDOD) protein
MNQRSEKDKIGEELAAQRFQMLKDIASELAGDIVFPTCFDAALRLRKDLQNPNITITQIAQSISIEPLVAAKITRLANAAIYAGQGGEVKDLPSAIRRVGLNVVRATALAIAMNEILHAKGMVCYAGLAQNLWEHSVRSAVAARLVARTFTRISPDEALLAGLVHDLGAFYMLYRATCYEELRERPETVKHLIMQWHESIGVTLLGALGLPQEIVEATADHDHPRAVPEIPKTLADVVYIANVLAGSNHAWLFELIELDKAEFTAVLVAYKHLFPEFETEMNAFRSMFG